MTSDETRQGEILSNFPVTKNVLSFTQENARDLHRLGTVP